MQTSQAQQNTPSMSDLFNQMTDLLKPASEGYRKDMQAAQAITPIDPAILQQAVAEGGPLSSAQDFASSSAWAMTPEMFKQTMERRPDLGRQISEATTLSDAIFGRTASRKAAESMAATNLGLGKEAASTAARMREGALDRTLRAEEGAADRALRTSEGAANRSLQRELADQDARLRKDLARITYGSGAGAILADYQAKGIPIHSQESERTIGTLLSKKPENLDPRVLYEAKLKGMEMGLLGMDGSEIKLKPPGAGWFTPAESYVVRVHPTKQIPYVFKKDNKTGKFSALKPVSKPMPSRVLGGSVGGSNTTSGPAYLMNPTGE